MLIIGHDPLSATERLSVFDDVGSNKIALDQTNEGDVVGRVKYNRHIKNDIINQSMLILKLDFLDKSIEMKVVSVHADDFNFTFSAASSSRADVLTISESSGVMLGSLTHNNKLYKFKPSGDGDTLIIEMPDEQFDDQVQDSVVLAASDAGLHRRTRAAALGGPDDGSEVDVIIAYTSEFMDDVGGW
jgi:hypothetical protein